MEEYTRISEIDILRWDEISLRQLEERGYDVVAFDGDEKLVICGRYGSPYHVPNLRARRSR